MDYYVVIVLLTLMWSTSHVVKGSLKSKSDGSFDYTNVRNFCSTCKVTRKLSNYTAKKNSRLTLKCAFRGIHPRNITWFKNGKRLKATKNIAISHWTTQNGSRLRIRKATSKDEGRYSCVGRNPRDQYILTTGYVKIKRADDIYVKRQPTTIPSIPAKQRNGKCELYKGKICAPYIQDNVLIYVENAPKKSQEFIETKLVFGFQHMEKNLTKSCRPSTLPLWCHYHFPRCSLVNSRAEPRSICKSECHVIQSQYCKAEYEWTRKSSLQRSEDDLFPDCQTLPVEDPLQSKCVSIKRHVPSLQPGPPGKPASGQCQRYNGDVCASKRGKKVFVKDGMKILDIEKVIKETLKMPNYVSKQCQSFVQPLLCQLRLPDCDSSSSTPKAKPICQDECLVLKNRFCKKEYSDVNKFSATSIFFDCNSVAPLTSASGKCSPIGVPKEFLGTHNITIPKRPVIGRCQPYKGSICKEFLDKKNIFLEVGNLASNIERKLKIAISNIETFHISPKCQRFVLPLMCHHLFPYCESNSQPKPSYICRQDCNRIRFDFCPTEYILAEQETLTGNILFPRCQDLSESNERCTSLRRHFITNRTEPIPGDCFHYKGGEYKGFTNTTESGTPCQRWDEIPGASYPELNVEHNFCRNPGGKRKKPWCFTMEGIQMCNIPKCGSYDATLNGSGKDYLGTLNKTFMGNFCQAWHKHEPKHNWVHNYCRNPKGSKRERPWCYVGKDKWEYCDVPKVAARKFPDAGGHLSNLLYTVIPCVVFGLVVAIVIIAVCWKQHKQGPDVIKKNTRMTITVLLPEIRTIPAENISLPKFLGNGKFGSMYIGEIYSDDGNRASRFVKVALKESSEELITQAKRWSQFHHPNLLTIDAITSGSEPMTLVYEPAGHGNLYQYLIYHSPNNPNFTKDHALLGKANLLDISRQVAAGMAYLSSHGYVHEELMTRNCQVAHSMVIKITDFTIDRDVCYYRRPDKRPIALGWMAPETLQTETYTVYSDVWAFGILLWEIFTYGFQPYFGFTFPEVREKILNMVLLEQPRDCIPVIYDLMKTCWKKNPTHRPQFADLHEDLNDLCDEFLDDEENEPRYVTALNL